MGLFWAPKQVPMIFRKIFLKIIALHHDIFNNIKLGTSKKIICLGEPDELWMVPKITFNDLVGLPS